MKLLKFLTKKKLPKQFRFRYTSDKFPGVDKELKLRWIEEVDSKEIHSIINLVKGDSMRFLTLPDAFRTCSSEEDVDKADLNEDVKQVVKMNLKEFEAWKGELK